MSLSRRDMMRAGAAALGGSLALKARSVAALPIELADPSESPALAPQSERVGPADGRYEPVVTPNGASLPWKMVDGAKVFHLIAEEVDHEFAPGLRAKCWGYNGRVHGPTIEAVEGDQIRIYVTNRLPAATTVHWHGVLLPNGMDGVGGLTQRPIPPGETFKYEFPVRQHGTFMYHSHHDEMIQMAMGMMGMMVFHPQSAAERVDRDFAIMLSQWKIVPGTYRPDPNEMTDFNVLTLNARAFPGTEPLVARKDQRVRIRFGNLSAMDHHPMHLHGFAFHVTATDGGPIAPSARRPETTVLVPVGTTRTIEFVADAPGDWAMHCHMTHHMMNQMGHDFPNMTGVDPGDLDQRVRSLLPEYMTMGTDGMGEMGMHVGMGHMSVPENSIPMVGADGPFGYVTMGGMVNVLKIREHLDSYDDPDWYEHPPGTVADAATAEELRRDGIET